MPPFLVSPDEQKLSPKPPEFHVSVRRVCKGLHNVAESLHPAVRQNNPEFAFTIEDFRLPWRFFYRIFILWGSLPIFLYFAAHSAVGPLHLF